MKKSIHVTEIDTKNEGGGKVTFPLKLWQAVNSEQHLISWSDDGKSVMVDAAEYEEDVMEVHPGLVKISTFNNLRRLMRWYSFTWSIDDAGYFMFSHPYFKMDRIDLLPYITPRKKGDILGEKLIQREDDDDADYIPSPCPGTRNKNNPKQPRKTFNFPDANAKPRRKYNKRHIRAAASTCDSGVQTEITMCNTDTRFLGTLLINGRFQDFYRFDNVDQMLLEYIENHLSQEKSFDSLSERSSSRASMTSVSTDQSSQLQGETVSNSESNMSGPGGYGSDFYTELRHGSQVPGMMTHTHVNGMNSNNADFTHLQRQGSQILGDISNSYVNSTGCVSYTSVQEDFINGNDDYERTLNGYVTLQRVSLTDNHVISDETQHKSYTVL